MSDLRRTSLTPYAATMRDPDPDGARKLAARQWHQDGTIVLLPDSIRRLNTMDRDLVEAIAAKHYGPRG